jgi:hypothetical protein
MIALRDEYFMKSCAAEDEKIIIWKVAWADPLLDSGFDGEGQV